MKKIIILTCIAIMILSCSKNIQTGSDHSSQTSTGTKGTEEQQAKSQDIIPELQTYLESEDQKLNEINAVNVNDLHLTYDFSYFPTSDESLVLPFNSIHAGPMIGCSSAVGFEFNIYKLGPDNKINSSAKQGLGSEPIQVRAGEKYIVRVSLFLQKSCLGLHYQFAIRASN